MIEKGTRCGALLLALAVGLLLTGCGGDDTGGGDSPEQVTEDTFAAIADADGERLCELVSEATAQAAADAAGVETCEEGAQEPFDAEAADELLSQAEAAEVGEATIDGDTATVEVFVGGESREIDLVKEDDEWKMVLEY